MVYWSLSVEEGLATAAGEYGRENVALKHKPLCSLNLLVGLGNRGCLQVV